jgi:hypothetical protein
MNEEGHAAAQHSKHSADDDGRQFLLDKADDESDYAYGASSVRKAENAP